MFMRFLAFIAVFAAIQPAFAKPPAFSGEELLKMCVSKYDTDYGFCAGYVSAIAQAMLTESVGNYRACNHGNVRSQQSIDLFTSYAELFPEQLQVEAATAVAASLARAFPCH